jgi:bifunctional non-homologous end joining protein LigD
MSLTTYRQKRHFDRTSEPKGESASQARPGWHFVIQKHAARRLHYDFRLEHQGVLKSWAVPQGPSLDPTQKRLAVQVEDHPVEYSNFEGIIPAGEYGGGTVLLWDHGTWSSDEDVTGALKRGKLKFHLNGEKLHGGWTLVRMRAKAGETKENWLLIKERDEEARPLADFDVLDERPESVSSGRTLSEVTADPKRTWRSNRTKDDQRPAATPRVKKASSRAAGNRKQRGAMPTDIEPQLATLVDEAPVGGDWVHEIKIDGYRILSYLDEGAVTLKTRNQNDWTARFPEIADALRRMTVGQALFDGEVAALLPNGASNFQALQTALSEQKTSQLVYFVFDLLFLDGQDLRGLPLEARKANLAEVLAASPQSRVRLSEHLDGNGAQILSKCCQLDLEGIVSKRRLGRYEAGRGDSWLKVKCVHREEFVVGGFTDSAASRKSLGALLVGYFDKSGDLIYAGKVGTGFSARSESEMRERLKARETDSKPFKGAVEGERKSTTHWVRPEVVVQVQFSNWTGDGRLRHPSFQGLREDKPAGQVRLERPQSELSEKPTKKKTSKQADNPKSAKPRAARSKRKPPALQLSKGQIEELNGIKLTHPAKILYPDMGLTKQDLVSYYAEVSPWMLPHVLNRPLSLVRCPDGEGGTCFYQKHAAAGTPTALQRVMIKEKNKQEPYLVIQSLAGLLSLVQIGVLEIHVWGSTLEDIEKPDRLIFDLDPDPTVPWPEVVAAAKEVRERLRKLRLESFAKTSGGKGLHVVLPIERSLEWPAAKRFCRTIAAQMASDSPSRYTANMSKAERHGRIYVDYLRNDRGATAIAPYSTRSRPGAAVATPISWREVSAAIRADHFNVENVPSRLAAMKKDPWQEIGAVRQALTDDILRQIGMQ